LWYVARSVPSTNVSSRFESHETTEPAGSGIPALPPATGKVDRTVSRQASIRATWSCVNITMPRSSV